MFIAAAAEVSFTEQLTPFLPLVGTIAGGVVVGLFALYNKRRGAAPDVKDIWQQQVADHKALDAERRMRRKLEDLAGQIWVVFVGYVRRVQSGGSIELTTREQEVITNGVDITDTAS